MEKTNKVGNKIKKIFYSIEEFEKCYFPKSYEEKLAVIDDPKEFGRKLAEISLERIFRKKRR